MQEIGIPLHFLSGDTMKLVKHSNALMTAFAAVVFTFSSSMVQAQDASPLAEKIVQKIDLVLKEARIPGAAVIVVKGSQVLVNTGVGFANLETQTPVTPQTLFELGSCSKSFTALAILQLAEDGFIKLDDPVSKHFPGFEVFYKKKKSIITIDHLVHHTSGLPWSAFGKIPKSRAPNALKDFVYSLSGMTLENTPGKVFIYSNANYDIAGAIIEEASGMRFEQYMAQKIFVPMGMTGTYIGTAGDDTRSGLPAATGYKISYGEPRAFESPVFRGNFPAGYVVTNGEDMAKWLRAQLGTLDNPLSELFGSSHNFTHLVRGIPYSMGWFVLQDAGTEIFHAGNNPNFSAYVAFRPQEQLAVAVLANSAVVIPQGKSGTVYLGQMLMKNIRASDSPEDLEEFVYNGGRDSIFTTATYGAGALTAIVIAILLYILIDTLRGVRRLEGFTLKKLAGILITLVATSLVGLGVYFIPDASMGFSWEGALAWAPESFPMFVKLLGAFLVGLNLLFLVSALLPYKDQTSFKSKYIKPIPLILFLSFIAGLSSAAAVFLISTSFFPGLELKYTIYYFGLAVFMSVLGQKIVQTKMIKIANDIVYELRMKLINKIFATRFQMFEKIESGKVYSTLNNDTEAIATSASLVVSTISSFITALAAFVYLSAISLSATLATLGFALLMGGFYIIVGKKARKLMEQMRDTQNVFMKLIEGLVQGFREISMHLNKKIAYEKDVEESTDKYRNTRVSAFVKFVNANLVSSSMILVLLAAICFSFPRIFPEMSLARLISFIMVLLYMIGPITAIMSSFPNFIRIKVSWDRIQKFIKEIPAMEELEDYKRLRGLSHKGKQVNSLEAKNISYHYPGEDGRDGFSVGPIDLEVKKGEILFLVGGNGSGKTTLAKILTGLYAPDTGSVTIDGMEIEGDDYLGEYFSVVFGDAHLFKKLYNVDMKTKRDEIARYLDILQLEDKVDIKDGSFTTVDLSGGQRKRLALLQCYLEDCPIYLFDEVAADQDPEFRMFFYRDLLMRMKENGKIVIAITHDDHYFDVADKIIKLDMGQIDTRFLPGLKGKSLKAVPKESV